MKIRDAPPFFKTVPPILPTPPFLREEKSEPPYFQKFLKLKSLHINI